ncbi:hypothetical protein U1Q18_027675 [Sarracenia purpurea var. burkii]
MLASKRLGAYPRLYLTTEFVAVAVVVVACGSILLGFSSICKKNAIEKCLRLLSMQCVLKVLVLCLEGHAWFLCQRERELAGFVQENSRSWPSYVELCIAMGCFAAAVWCLAAVVVAPSSDVLLLVVLVQKLLPQLQVASVAWLPQFGAVCFGECFLLLLVVVSGAGLCDLAAGAVLLVVCSTDLFAFFVGLLQFVAAVVSIGSSLFAHACTCSNMCS